MDAVFVNPPILIKSSVEIPTRAHNPFEHLGLGYLTAVLRKNGFSCAIVDSYITPAAPEKTADLILQHSPALVGFSATHEFLTSSVNLGRILRNRGYDGFLAMGGYLPTFLHRELMEEFPHFDFIVRGEGEETILELMGNLKNSSRWDSIEGLSFRRKGEVHHNSPRPLISDLSTLPHPVRDTLPQLMETHDYSAISSSRGCPRNCSFCSIRSFYNLSDGDSWRARTAADITDEMEHLVTEYKAGQIAFTDDNFLGPGSRGKVRAFEIAREILSRGLKTQFSILARVDSLDEGLLRLLKVAGLRSLFVGFESGVDRALETFGKGITREDNLKAIDLIKRLQIKCFPGFIMFDPYTTIDEIRQNLSFVDYAEKDNDFIRIDDLLGSLQPFTGTPIKSRLEKEGRLRIQPSELITQDAIPVYDIPDFRTETLRQAMKNLRNSLRRPLFDEAALLQRKWNLRDTALEAEFNGLVMRMRDFEKASFREALDMAEKLSKPPEKGPDALTENAGSHVPFINSQVDEINEKIRRATAGLNRENPHDD